MSACVSSPITVLATQVGSAAPGPDADPLTALAKVADPRKARGCRHRLVTVLAISVAAVLAGARSLDDPRAHRRDVVHLAAHRTQRLGAGEIGPAAPAAARQVLDHLFRVIDQGQGAARRTRLLARLAPRTPPGPPRRNPQTIGRGRLRRVPRVAAQLALQLRNPRHELLDHPGLLDDQRKQLLARRVLQLGHETT